MIITVNAPVIANAGPDQTVCSAIAVSLNANTTTGGNWTGGAGTFSRIETLPMQIILLLLVKLEQQSH
jgi:hypothetical protein